MTIRLALTGDLMFGDHPVCLGHGVRTVVERLGAESLLAPAKGVLSAADLSIGNLECVLAEQSTRETELQRLEMRGNPVVATALRDAGFDVISVANNHVLQHGEPAFHESVGAIRSAGLGVVGLNDGANRSNVIERTIGGERLAIIAYSMRPERYSRATTLAYAKADAATIREHVRELSGSFTYVILCLHWGEEYMTDPSPNQVRFGRQLADDGASLVVGHHPHVLQGFEQRGRSAILYSLGNFIFDKWRDCERETAIAEVRLAEGAVESIALLPFMIDRSFVPQRVEGGELEARVSHLHQLNQRLGVAASSSEQDYAAQADKAYLQYRLDSYAYFARNLLRYPPRVVGASLARSFRRRLGLG